MIIKPLLVISIITNEIIYVTLKLKSFFMYTILT